jgi:hypothetical protein
VAFLLSFFALFFFAAALFCNVAADHCTHANKMVKV